MRRSLIFGPLLSLALLIPFSPFAAAQEALVERKIPAWATFERSVLIDGFVQQLNRNREGNQSLRVRTRYLDPAVNRFAGFVGGFHHFNRDLVLDEPPSLDTPEWLGHLGIAIGFVRGKHLWEVDLLGAMAGSTLGPALAIEGEHTLGKHFGFYHRVEATFFSGATEDLAFDADQGFFLSTGGVGVTLGYRIFTGLHMNRNGPRVGLRLRFKSPKIPFIFPSLA